MEGAKNVSSPSGKQLSLYESDPFDKQDLYRSTVRAFST